MDSRKNSTHGLRYLLVAIVALAALCLTGCDPLGGNSTSSNPTSSAPTPADLSCAPNLAYSQQVSEMVTNVVVRDSCGHVARIFSPPSVGWFNSPSLSPDGQTVAFSASGQTGPAEVEIGNVVTGQITQLTTMNSEVLDVAFSPDGQEIAFDWRAGPDSQQGTSIVAADGKSAPIEVSSLSGTPAWSPDGKTLVITQISGAGSTTVAAVDVASHTQTVLINGLSVSPAFYSPDGKFLLFGHSPDGAAGSNLMQLWMYDVATKQMRQLTHLPYGITPNGNTIGMDNAWKLYYTVVPSGQQTNPATGIHMLNLNTGADKVLPPDLAGIDYSISVARTGAVVAAPVVIGESCPSVEFIGVRGSGETADQNGGLGPTVAAVNSELKSRWPDMGTNAIDYPAIPIEYSLPNYALDYTNSVLAGEQALTEFWEDFSASCPSSTLIVVGFSQGAHVVGDVLEQISAAETRNLVAAALFGDPKFNPNDTQINQGNYDPRYWGSYKLVVPDTQMRRTPTNLDSSVHSYCMLHDPVCNYTPANLVTCLDVAACIHLRYADNGRTSDAVRWINSRLGGLPTNVG